MLILVNLGFSPCTGVDYNNINILLLRHRFQKNARKAQPWAGMDVKEVICYDLCW